MNARRAETTRTAMIRKWFSDDDRAWDRRCDIVLFATAQDYATSTGVASVSTSATVRTYLLPKANLLSTSNLTVTASWSAPSTISPINSPTYVDTNPALIPPGQTVIRNYVSVTVSYHDQSDGQTHSMDPYSLSGGPPTYQPCTVVATDFTATWTGTSAMPAVNVTFGGDQSKLAGCTDWVYHLTDPGGAACGSASPQGGPPGGATIPLSCATAPSENDWSVTITYTEGPPTGAPAGIATPLIEAKDYPGTAFALFTAPGTATQLKTAAGNTISGKVQITAP